MHSRTSFSILLFAATASLSAALPAFAEIDHPLKSIDEFGSRNVNVGSAVRVPGARVVLVDYDLVARDFPIMAKSPTESLADWKNRVDQWILKETAFIAKGQVRGGEKVNSPIQTTAETKVVHRPTQYNRAHILPIEGGGLMDAKGVGADFPSVRDHWNGLATLGEMIREFLYEKLVSAIFKHSAENVRTVGCYAVVDFGFDVLHADGSRSPAGYVLRQAHIRVDKNISALDWQDALPVEHLLRRYGITSSGETYGFRAKGLRNADYDAANIQSTNNLETREVIDFGGYLAVEEFQQPIQNVRKTTLTGDYETIEQTWDRSFVQPNPDLRVPLKEWGDDGYHDPKADRPWRYSHELAENWRQGKASRQDFETHLNTMIQPALSRLAATPVEKICVRFLHEAVSKPASRLD